MPQGKEILSMEIVLERKNFIDKNQSGKPLVINSELVNIHFVQKKLKKKLDKLWQQLL